MQRPIDQSRHDHGTVIERERMKDARILVGGVGALGNEVVKNLTMMSAGHIFLVDKDVIELHNFSRSAFFFFGRAEAAVHGGVPKAKFVADMIRSLNSDVRVSWYAGDVADLGAGFLDQFTLAVSCFDARLPRYILNERCAEAGIPLVDAGLGANFSLSAAAYLQVVDVRGGTSCYACRLPERERRRLDAAIRVRGFGCAAVEAAVREAGGVPTTVMMASIMGSLQALEATKLISRRDGLFRPRVGTYTRFDFQDMTSNPAMPLELPRDPTCPAHRHSERVVVRLPFRSDTATLQDLWDAASDIWDDPDLRLELPNPFWPEGSCSECGRHFTWVSVLQRRLGEAFLALDPAAVIPEGKRLPCGCPRGLLLGEPGEIPTEYYRDPSGPRATLSLRETGLPWGSTFGVVSEWLAEPAALVPGDDFGVLTGWKP